MLNGGFAMEKDDKVEVSPKKEPKTGWWWLRNTKGKPDAALTMMVLAFLTVTASYVASVVGEIDIKSIHLVFEEFNVSYATTVLIPLMSLYFGRRWTDANAKNK